MTKRVRSYITIKLSERKVLDTKYFKELKLITEVIKCRKEAPVPAVKHSTQSALRLLSRKIGRASCRERV